MKKIGKLNGKVVVAGDKNLITENQIHYEEREGNITLSKRINGELNSVTGSAASSGGGSKMEYYKLNLDKYASMGNDAPFGAVFYIGYGYPSLLRIKQNDIFVIGSYGLAGYNDIHNVEDFLSIGVDAISFDPNIKIIVNNPQGIQFYANNVKEYMDYIINQGAYHEDDALIPITEEEFYNLN